MRFNITTATSTVDDGEGPRAIVRFKSVKDMGEFRLWLDAEREAAAQPAPTRWQLFRAFIRGRL